MIENKAGHYLVADTNKKEEFIKNLIQERQNVLIIGSDNTEQELFSFITFVKENIGKISLSIVIDTSDLEKLEDLDDLFNKIGGLGIYLFIFGNTNSKIILENTYTKLI